MKKIFVSLMAALAICGAQATEPNRVIINPVAGSRISYKTDRIQDITFATVEGNIIADAKVLSVGAIGDENAVTVSVTMSEGCTAYKYVLVPQAMVAQYDDNVMAAFIDQNSPEVMYDGFESAAIQGISLDASTNYVFATLAFDGYGTPCEVSQAKFSTPSANLVGDPKCDYKVNSTGLFSAEITVTPNKDVKGWACVIFEKGEMEANFEMYAPMFGFANYGQMIKMWGSQRTGTATVSWKDLAPNTDYEVAIQPWDANDNFAPMAICNLSTKSQGGTGEAIADVELGEYRLNDWDGQQLPSQFITYVPNDQTVRYRFGVYLKSQYLQDPEAYKADVAQLEPMPNMANWWFYDEFTTDYQINPNTEYVVITAAQNINYEWGEIKVNEYKTPSQAASVIGAKAPSMMSISKAIATRVMPTEAVEGSKVPAMRIVRN